MNLRNISPLVDECTISIEMALARYYRISSLSRARMIRPSKQQWRKSSSESDRGVMNTAKVQNFTENRVCMDVRDTSAVLHALDHDQARIVHQN